MALSAPASGFAGEYLLGAQDKVRLKIYEWRASKDVIFEWGALNDEFAIAADGTLSLPFAGEIRAAGVTPGELGDAISSQLMVSMGLGREPDVAVEVVEFRPFYIVGDVTDPGEFPYRPGLTVLQALTIAKGLRRSEQDTVRLEREIISGRGDVGLLALSRVSLMARKARLEAELEGAESITFPPELISRQDDRTVAIMMEQERSVFDARRQGLSTQSRALEELKDFLEKEIESLKRQVSFHDRQVEIMQKELSGVSSLVEKGYAGANREMSLERALVETQSGRLSAETALLRARQDLSRTDISILELHNNHANEVTVQLRETETQLNDAIRKSQTAQMLLHDSEITAPRLLARRARAERAEPRYVIVRQTGDGPTEIEAEESTAVMPGDTVKVEIPLSFETDDYLQIVPGPISADDDPLAGASASMESIPPAVR
nr:polysaccharide biosynthesis/export family protein [Mesorhizobium xinjiangense]